MSDTALEYGPMPPDEYDRVAAMLEQALFFGPGDMRSWLDAIGPEHVRVVRKGGQLAAGMAGIPMGHWFGGRSVATIGITAVGVAPEYRGANVGREMLRKSLEEYHASGIPLASLYPATTTFYRRNGFERAATRTIYEAPLAALTLRDYTLDIIPTAADDPELRRVYNARARITSGTLDRPAALWKTLLTDKSKPPHIYLAARGGQAEGYVAFVQGGETLSVRDICALTGAAARRLLTLLADHRTMVDAMRWSGAPMDALLLSMPEQKHKVHWQFDLMLRIVDVAGALAARGYPPGLGATLQLDIRDDVLPWNNARFTLEVSDGRAAVHRGGDSRLRMHIRDLAPLYSGFLTPNELRIAGTLDGPDADLATAALLFSGPRPWTPDMF